MQGSPFEGKPYYKDPSTLRFDTFVLETRVLPESKVVAGQLDRSI